MSKLDLLITQLNLCMIH